MHVETIPFDHQSPTRIIFGPDSVDRVGELAASWSAKRVLIVTDPGVESAGHVEHVRTRLEGAGMTVAVFNGVIENPTTKEVEACVAFARETGIDTIIGLGGGSSLDTAKGCNFIQTNGGQMRDYWGVGKASKPMLPLIAIPTTAGTGSECQSFALIADETTHQKMACGDLKAAARVAILDPKLTLTQPANVAACTGIDTVAHAIESAVTKKRSALSWIYSREAFLLANINLPVVLESPTDLDARGRMQLAAAFGGTAIENSMLGAAHAAANPLTAHYDIVHGLAVGMMLPVVVAYNCADNAVAATYALLARDARLVDADASDDRAVGALVDHLRALLTVCGLPARLADCDLPRKELATLAEEAAGQWTAGFNPRAISASDFEKLYDAAWSGEMIAAS